MLSLILVKKSVLHMHMKQKVGYAFMRIRLLEPMQNSWHVYISKSLSLLSDGVIDLEAKEFNNLIKLLESYK